MEDIPQPANEGMDHQAQLDAMTTVIGELLSDAVLLMRVINPDMQPMGAAAEVYRWTTKALGLIVPPGVLPGALLINFEATHEKPMNFVQTEQAKQTLTTIASRRRQLDAKGKGLILPPGVG
jgi:hypothetical protein